MKHGFTTQTISVAIRDAAETDIGRSIESVNIYKLSNTVKGQ